MLFVDVAGRAVGDPAGLARVLGIDAYRARMLLTSGAPFLAHGFRDRAAAEASASVLSEAGLPASAHAPEALASLPAAEDTTGFTTTGTGVSFIGQGGAMLPFGGEAVRCLIAGRITVELETTSSNRRTGFGSSADVLAGLAGTIQETSQQKRHYFRLEIFTEPAPGRIVRFGIRHDAFDWSGLGSRKTLAALKNLQVLREGIVRMSNGAPFCESFQRTEMARVDMQPDEWIEGDIHGSKGKRITVRSNRLAFDLFARARFLHEMSRRQKRTGHFLEF